MSARTLRPARGRRLAAWLTAAVLALGGVLALGPARAPADFTAVQLLSGTPTQQFDSADLPALAAGGGYAVFDGSLAGVAGIYRRNLATGAIDLVAGHNAAVPAIDAPDATAPSVSADGRFVAFTTSADLDPADVPAADRGCPEVYVRDMNLPATVPGAYILVAARDGSTMGLTFGASCAGSSPNGTLPVAGAQAAPATAISADGRRVAFTVLSPSDLAVAAPGTATTPASQVAVRDLAARTTTVVSVTPAGQPTPGGGAFPSTTSESIGVGRVAGERPYGLTASTAAISADGTTVAWLGTDVPAQVTSATDVAPGMRQLGATDPGGEEVEPLWRRIADGPGAVTKRLLAGAGLDFYATTYQGNAAQPPVLGGSQTGDFHEPIGLSADGSTVAMTADAPRPPAEASAAGNPSPPYDAYVAHVAPDAAAAPQVTPLTEILNYTASPAATATVLDPAVSPDGTQVAFETARTQFSLSPPVLITPPTQYDNVAVTYVVNLTDGTMALATRTYDGSPANRNAGYLAFDNAGQLAFGSQATNLFYGDVYPDNALPQTYLIDQIPQPSAVAPVQLGAVPMTGSPAPGWTLSVTVSPRRDGTVAVQATVPGAGQLSARAAAQLASTVSPASHRPRRHGPSRTAPIPARTVAGAAAFAAHTSTITLRLTVSHGYRALLSRRSGIYAVVTIRFTAAGHQPLSQAIPVTFRRLTVAGATHRRVTARRRRTAGGHLPRSGHGAAGRR